jgi:hypothetical protein
MEGVIDLIAGRWVLKDDADVMYLLPYPGETAGLLREPRFAAGPDATFAYAEPGMEGIIDLIAGRWVLKDDADAMYLLPYPGETVYALSESGLRIYPGMGGTIIIVDGRWVLRDNAGVQHLLPYPKPDDGREFNLPENEIVLRKIYDTIVSLEAAPDRPPEVIVDLGPVRDEKHQGRFLSAASSAKPESGRESAFLLFTKNLASGKYYLQIGLFDQKEVLARKLATLNWVYPYALETNENRQSPKYKLLVGPVNEGESNALLLRFKRYGYHDAFIRREG